MKNKALLFFVIVLFAALRSEAQILNAGFESWKLDTTQFNGFLTIPAETYSYPDPVDWTSSNAISAMSVAGGFKFVEQSTDFAEGEFAVQIKTDTLAPINMGPLGKKTLTVPGFVMNGNFVIDPSNLVNGLNITPMAVKGAGQPFTQRLQSIKGKYKYEPVFTTIKNANDTCLVWATLRKGNTVIADAIFKSSVSTNNIYQSFEVNFEYVSCETPDTLVILIASSIPNVPGLFSGQSDLVRGSVLIVDTLDYEALAGAPVIANNDTSSTIKNVARQIDASENDEYCDGQVNSLTCNVSTAPKHGTAVPDWANGIITYTPATDYAGNDTFYYTLNDGTNTSRIARVSILVHNLDGINEAGLLPVSVYPVPATNQVQVRFDSEEKATAKVYDMLGAVVATYKLNGAVNVLPVSQLANGMYGVQIVNEGNNIIGLSRFTISR